MTVETVHLIDLSDIIAEIGAEIGDSGELHPSRETRKLGTVILLEKIVTGEWGVGRGGGQLPRPTRRCRSRGSKRATAVRRRLGFGSPARNAVAGVCR
jgi:hypothetical protein